MAARVIVSTVIPCDLHNVASTLFSGILGKDPMTATASGPMKWSRGVPSLLTAGSVELSGKSFSVPQSLASIQDGQPCLALDGRARTSLQR